MSGPERYIIRSDFMHLLDRKNFQNPFGGFACEMVGRDPFHSIQRQTASEAKGVSDYLQTLTRELIAKPPFCGGICVEHIISNLNHTVDYAVVIPVRDEEERLARCFQSLSTAMQQSSRTGALVFVVNNTIDRSFDILAEQLCAFDYLGGIVKVTTRPELACAPIARRLAMDIGQHIAPHGHVLSSDADTQVGRNWVCAFTDAFDKGYSLVCEDVELNPEELAALPEIVQKLGYVERRYYDVCERLWHRWSNNTAKYLNLRASGASIGVTSEALRTVGGLPTPKVGEDGALRDAVLAHGLRAVQLANLGTYTSARLDSRAVGGCGETLAQRAIDPNPESDSALVSIAVLRHRAAQSRGGNVRSTGQTGAPLRYRELCEQLKIGERLLSEETDRNV